MRALALASLAAIRRRARGRRQEAVLAGLTLLAVLLPGGGDADAPGPAVPGAITPVPLTAVLPDAPDAAPTPAPRPNFVPPDPAAPSVTLEPLRVVPTSGEPAAPPILEDLEAIAAALRRHEELRLAAQATLATDRAALEEVATPGRVAGIDATTARLQERGWAEVVEARHAPELRRYTGAEAVVVSRYRSRTALVDPDSGSQVRGAVTEEQAVAWRLVRGEDGRWRVDDLALLTPPGTAPGP